MADGSGAVPLLLGGHLAAHCRPARRSASAWTLSQRPASWSAKTRCTYRSSSKRLCSPLSPYGIAANPKSQGTAWVRH